MFGSLNFVIAAKVNSTRVPNKNFRPFYGEKSLVDIQVEKLLQIGVSRDRIFLSCEDQKGGPQSKAMAEYGIEYIPRPVDLCRNSSPLTTNIRFIASQLNKEDIVYLHPTCPTFNEYGNVLKVWNLTKENKDSLTVAFLWSGHLLDERFQPMGWSFGEHHTVSQYLSAWKTLPFCCSILSRKAITATGYYLGRNPHWYVPAQDPAELIDINTQTEFEIAQFLYGRQQECQSHQPTGD